MTLFTQITAIMARSVRSVFRRPAALMPSIIFPVILLAVNSAGLKSAVNLPNFPAESYLAFAITVPFMQSALFATNSAGAAIAEDIELGFLNRLALTPMRGTALVLGQLAGATAVAVIAACFYLTVGLIAGVRMETGIPGAIILILLSVTTATAFASIGAYAALKTGSSEVIQSLFPLMFITFFLSSINLPRDLIEIDWFRTLATWNPVSYLIEGMRSLVITGWDAQALGTGFAVALAILSVSLFGCSRALRLRLVRT